MRILLSSLLFLFVGCASYPTKKGFSPTSTATQEPVNPYFSDSSKDYVYKAQIEAFGKNFGGILAIKKLGNAHHRLVFTTQMGNTIFDFTFIKDKFKVNKVLKELDRKILINILKRDFSALLLENPKIEKTFEKEAKMLQNGFVLNKKHYYLSENDQLVKIIRVRNSIEKVVIQFQQVSENIAKDILIAHKNIKLKINLKSI